MCHVDESRIRKGITQMNDENEIEMNYALKIVWKKKK